MYCAWCACVTPRVCSDLFFCVDLKNYRHKDWVSKMLIPYFLFFGTTCIGALVSLLVKAHLFVHKVFVRHENSAPRMQQRKSSLGGIVIPAGLAAQESVHKLRAKFHTHRKARRVLYTYILVVAFEDLPMGKLTHEQPGLTRPSC